MAAHSQADLGVQAKSPGPRCRVQGFLDDRNLSVEARARVEEWISGYSGASVHRALVGEWGDEAPSLWSISNHRRGKCRCNRKA